MTANLFLLSIAIVLCGIVWTRIVVKRKHRRIIAQRLAELVELPSEQKPVNLLRKSTWSESVLSQLDGFKPLLEYSERLLVQAGYEGRLLALITLMTALVLAPLLIAFALGLNLTLAALVSAGLGLIPFVVLRLKAGNRRMRFCQQLPDAMDLMVSVLRSGHSIPQAIKAISEEAAEPLGEEFNIILQRMNLGQPLGQAIAYSAQRFHSYELDLIRRAVSIQSEVGGSLAELLDKTNSTLRQRLKLVRQVEVITAQSKLTAIIVGLLPVVLAVALNYISPGYLQPLIDEGLGRNMLIAAVVLEAIGLVVMKRLSTIKV